jgi:hypothetical protein
MNGPTGLQNCVLLLGGERLTDSVKEHCCSNTVVQLRDVPPAAMHCRFGMLPPSYFRIYRGFEVYHRVQAFPSILREISF